MSSSHRVVLLVIFCGLISVPTLAAQETAAPTTSAAAADAPPADPLAMQVDRAIDVSSRRFLTIEHHFSHGFYDLAIVLISIAPIRFLT